MIVLLYLVLDLLFTDLLSYHANGERTTYPPRIHLPPPNRTAMLKDFQDTYEEDDSNQTFNIKNGYDRNKIRNWRGWTPSEVMLNDWDKWFYDYDTMKNMKKNVDYVDPNNVHEFEGKRGPGSFPRDWADMGSGNQGVGPPPWAYEPIVSIKPRHCYLAIDQGEFCKGSFTYEKRFYYNPFLERCEDFMHKGCGGNKNSFKQKLDCVHACIKPSASGGCDPDSKIRIEKI